MATIDSKEIIDDIIAGKYDDDHDLVIKIVEYTNAWGNVTWGCVYSCEAAMGMASRYEIPSNFVQNPKVIWRREGY
jgi:hypothetical protein